MKKYDFDMIAIGGGAGGFVSSKVAAGMGKRVALIEKHKLGGDCTHYGCVPSKALLKIAHLVHDLSRVERFGLGRPPKFRVDTGRVLSHVRAVVRQVYNSHLPESFERAGIRVLFGSPEFIDGHGVSLGGRTLTAGKFIIATGSRALIPPIEGIDTVPYLTNTNFFNLRSLPKSILVLGGGPIGIELASAMNRLGVEVTVVEMLDRILFREDAELGGLLEERLKAEGLRILTGVKAVRCAAERKGVALHVQDVRGGRARAVRADAMLVAVGRAPNTDGLGLEKAGVAYGPKGVSVNGYLETSAPGIHACGDVAGPFLFSHMAEYQAVTAARNALLPFRKKTDYRHVVWCTFTDPELAHGGLTEEEARERHGDRVRVYRHEYRNTDRGKTDMVETGMAKIVCTRKGEILGVHILGPGAGEIMHEVQLAKSLGVPFHRIGGVIHAYPSYSDVVRQPSKYFYIDRLRENPAVKLAQKLFTKKDR